MLFRPLVPVVVVLNSGSCFFLGKVDNPTCAGTWQLYAWKTAGKDHDVWICMTVWQHLRAFSQWACLRMILDHTFLWFKTPILDLPREHVWKWLKMPRVYFGSWELHKTLRWKDLRPRFWGLLWNFWGPWTVVESIHFRGVYLKFRGCRWISF